MKKYQFYGWEQADVPATSKTYEKIKNPKERRLEELVRVKECMGFSDRAEIIIVIMWWGIVALI